MAEKVIAPFTADQIASLNAYQYAGVMHPFTCGNRDDGRHFYRLGEKDLGALVAEESGWVCGLCDYTQNWAHAFMADWSWRHAFGSPVAASSETDKAGR